MKLSVEVESQIEKKEDFQRQIIEISHDDAKMQKSNLMLIMFERKTMIELVLISSFEHE